MALRGVAAELPEGVEELCLVRFGLIARGFSARRYARGVERAISAAATRAIADGAGLLRDEPIVLGRGHRGRLQYWSSFAAMDAWSHREPHAAWWRGAVDRMRSRGDLGVYHEAYLVPRASVESIYLDCDSPVGLSAFSVTRPADGPRSTARDRLGRRGTDPPGLRT